MVTASDWLLNKDIIDKKVKARTAKSGLYHLMFDFLF